MFSLTKEEPLEPVEKSIRIGQYTLTEVHPDMIRIWDDNTGNAATDKEWEIADVIQRYLETR